jgi:hypothetical protein
MKREKWILRMGCKDLKVRRFEDLKILRPA